MQQPLDRGPRIQTASHARRPSPTALPAVPRYVQRRGPARPTLVPRRRRRAGTTWLPCPPPNWKRPGWPSADTGTSRDTPDDAARDLRDRLRRKVHHGAAARRRQRRPDDHQHRLPARSPAAVRSCRSVPRAGESLAHRLGTFRRPDAGRHHRRVHQPRRGSVSRRRGRRREADPGRPGRGHRRLAVPRCPHHEAAAALPGRRRPPRPGDRRLAAATPGPHH